MQLNHKTYKHPQVQGSDDVRGRKQNCILRFIKRRRGIANPAAGNNRIRTSSTALEVDLKPYQFFSLLKGYRYLA
jgi:hypothetical protein